MSHRRHTFLRILAWTALAAAPAGAADLGPAEKAVEAAGADASKIPLAKSAVAEAIAADPQAVAPRVLEARLLLVEAKTKKTSERKAAFAGVLEVLAKASALDPWDPLPFRAKADAMTAMGTPDHDSYVEALRAAAIRSPGDAAAREAYVRQQKDAPRLAVGDPLPKVQWKDADGNAVASETLWAKGPAIIELYRSAVWCPYCQKQLYALHDAADAIAAAGITLVACSPDTTETLTKVRQEGLKEKKPYKVRLLSDPEGRTADKLGLLNPDTVKPGVRPEAFGLPFPTTIIVDERGIVGFVKVHGDIRDRVTPAEMLKVVQKLRATPAATK